MSPQRFADKEAKSIKEGKFPKHFAEKVSHSSDLTRGPFTTSDTR
jgi:hypothetical protein